MIEVRKDDSVKIMRNDWLNDYYRNILRWFDGVVVVVLQFVVYGVYFDWGGGQYVCDWYFFFLCGLCVYRVYQLLYVLNY